MPETPTLTIAGRAYSGLRSILNRLVYKDESRSLGTRTSYTDSTGRNDFYQCSSVQSVSSVFYFSNLIAQGKDHHTTALLRVVSQFFKRTDRAQTCGRILQVEH